jgi:hypothetical protein
VSTYFIERQEAARHFSCQAAASQGALSVPPDVLLVLPTGTELELFVINEEVVQAGDYDVTLRLVRPVVRANETGATLLLE